MTDNIERNEMMEWNYEVSDAPMDEPEAWKEV